MNAGKKGQTGVFPNAPIPRETAQEATRGNSFCGGGESRDEPR
jgi:hypothetical protein